MELFGLGSGDLLDLEGLLNQSASIEEHRSMQFEIDEESIDLWSNIEIAKIANQRVEIYDTPNLPSSCAIFQYEESTSPTANKSSSIKTVVNERTREAISHDIFQVATAGPML